jgi:cytochrome P450
VTEVFDYQADRGKTPFDPPPRYEQLRDERPVSQVSMFGTKVWLVTRYADVRAVLGDERFSADNQKPGFPLFSSRSENLTQDDPAFVRMDPPEHGRLRGMVAAEFTRKRAVAMRPQIQQIVDQFTDGMLAQSPPADLFAKFALPIPTAVICMILGVPYEDHGFFHELSAIMMSGAEDAAIDAANQELTRFMGELVERKAKQPADDLISRLVLERESRGELTRNDVISMARALLVPGYETTSMMIVLGAAALLYHPAQLAALRENPALIPGAVEELLRYLTIVHTGLPRVAASDVKLGGQQIKAGDGVVCYLPSANRDGRRFEAPEVFDVNRKSRGNLAFGSGIHRCIAQWLAKAEMEVAFETLIRRFPELRLAGDFDQVRFRQKMLVYGVWELPVTW